MKPLASAMLLIVPVASWTLADRFAGRAVFPRPRRVGSTAAAASSSSRQPQQQQIPSQPPSAMSTKQHHQEIRSFLDRPVESTVGDTLPSSTTSQEAAALEDVQGLVRTIVRAADARKAEQIVALQVHRVTTLTSYLVILSGNSRPQNSAIAAAITRDVLDLYGMRPGGSGVPEGSAESGWMVLDYGSVMVHIMTPKSRLFYNVEGQWRQKGGVEMDVADCIVPNTVAEAAAAAATATATTTIESDEAGRGEARVEPAPEDDPFWS